MAKVKNVHGDHNCKPTTNHHISSDIITFLLP